MRLFNHRSVGSCQLHFGWNGWSCFIEVSLYCSATIDYNSLSMCSSGVLSVRHNAVLIALRLAAFLAGIGYSGYHNLFARYLGIAVVTNKYFDRVIELAFPHTKNILDEVCEDGKVEMMALPSSQLGSWKRAVTTSDGCWFFVPRPAVVWPCVDARG